MGSLVNTTIITEKNISAPPLSNLLSTLIITNELLGIKPEAMTMPTLYGTNPPEFWGWTPKCDISESETPSEEGIYFSDDYTYYISILSSILPNKSELINNIAEKLADYYRNTIYDLEEYIDTQSEEFKEDLDKWKKNAVQEIRLVIHQYIRYLILSALYQEGVIKIFPTGFDEMNIENIYIIKGDKKVLVYQFNDVKHSSPLDISGYTFTITVKKNIEDQTPVYQNVVTVGDGSNGQVEIVIDTSIQELAVGEYYYDIEMRTPYGFVRTIRIGKLYIYPDITR